MPKLLLKFETAVLKEITIPADKTSFSVGRKSDNDIAIDHPAVSGHHCKIYLSGGTFFVEDLGSTNGTFVNGKKILKAGLHHN
ncbi:MAG: FHA domain-containing protein, partial [bacterium]